MPVAHRGMNNEGLNALYPPALTVVLLEVNPRTPPKGGWPPLETPWELNTVRNPSNGRWPMDQNRCG